MEYLQVFDENKNMLEEKVLREQKKELTGNKHFMIIMLFIENSEGKFLLQKTSESRNSEIATTGGHVDFGYNGFDTALKEAKEELGITLLPNDLNYVDTLSYKNCFIELYYINKPININDLVLQEEEVESVDWYTIDEIKELIKENKLRKSNIEPFNRVLEYKKIKKQK